MPEVPLPGGVRPNRHGRFLLHGDSSAGLEKLVTKDVSTKWPHEPHASRVFTKQCSTECPWPDHLPERRAGRVRGA